jgi:hypothetical protein
LIVVSGFYLKVNTLHQFVSFLPSIFIECFESLGCLFRPIQNQAFSSAVTSSVMFFYRQTSKKIVFTFAFVLSLEYPLSKLIIIQKKYYILYLAHGVSIKLLFLVEQAKLKNSNPKRIEYLNILVFKCYRFYH